MVLVIYSFLGVIVEVVFYLVVEGVLESRLGLLYLPLRPIYGVGGVACCFSTASSRNRSWSSCSGMMIGSVVEFVARFGMEKGLGTISWDCSDKLLNLHGRICLQYSFCWGLLALLVLYVLDRFLYGL